MSRGKPVAEPTMKPELAREVTRAEFERLKSEVENLRLVAFSAIVPPRVGNFLLMRCGCGSFATRQHRIDDPKTGTHYLPACDACEFESPLLAFPGVEKTAEPLPGYAAEHVAEARRLNAARAQVMGGPVANGGAS